MAQARRPRLSIAYVGMQLQADAAVLLVAFALYNNGSPQRLYCFEASAKTQKDRTSVFNVTNLEKSNYSKRWRCKGRVFNVIESAKCNRPELPMLYAIGCRHLTTGYMPV
jgi:hypothetical protein